MKIKFVVVAVLAIIGVLATSFKTINNTGIAGRTGSPGEVTCAASGCHFGGTNPGAFVILTTSPSFTNNEFEPGVTYTVDITVNAAGYGKFGFGCEILDASNINAGTMQNAGAGVKFLNSGARKNAVHTTGKLNLNSATFTFEWVAPQSGTATFYVMGNAVNGNNQRDGDLPVPMPQLVLTAAEPVDPVGLNEQKRQLVQFEVFPNPSNSVSSVRYFQSGDKKMEIQVCDLSGKLLKSYGCADGPGSHTKTISLEELSSGAYFVKLMSGDKKLSQKLLLVQ